MKRIIFQEFIKTLKGEDGGSGWFLQSQSPLEVRFGVTALFQEHGVSGTLTTVSSQKSQN